mmetsp:Transcript_49923/g.121838  ORF Transcript_49923/g.121838 Transcript_49923/m.121838 type:complete len:309 (+) Transcript_49923:246-1172(+)
MRLEQHLAPLLGWVRQHRDGSPCANPRVVLVAHGSPDHDRQVGRAVDREVAESARVHAPGLALDGVEQGHAPPLRRPRHAPHGEGVLKGAHGRHVLAQLAPHNRHHLVHRRVRLYREEPRDRDRASHAHPREVAADEVDDHQVLSLVLDAPHQLLDHIPVLLGRDPPRPRALDWAALDDAPARHVEEPLGGGAADGRVGTEAQERRVGRLVPPAQDRVQRKGVHGHAGPEFGRQAELVALAVVDVPLACRNRLLVPLPLLHGLERHATPLLRQNVPAWAHARIRRWRGGGRGQRGEGKRAWPQHLVAD